MKNFALLLLFLFTRSAWAGGSPVPVDPEFVRAASEQIHRHHEGAPSAKNIIRVVYFYPADAAPLADWEERWQRILADVSAFYREELARHGFRVEGLPFEQMDGRYVLHLVRGKRPLAEYSYESGEEIGREVDAALQGKIDFEREHVLLVHALCRRATDGRYVFNAPYYGGGDSDRGICHAADCELLDPLLLTETKRKISYSEHYHPRVEQTLAAFNSMYLGGVAHELGHGLGLPHDMGGPDERRRTKSSLMGHGNLTYRENFWGGSDPAFFSVATAFRLASHPLLTQSNRGRWEPVEAWLERCAIGQCEGGFTLSGKIKSRVPVYAAIAYLWRKSGGNADEQEDHDSLSFPARVKDGEFQILVDSVKLKSGTYRLRLELLLVSGSVKRCTLYLGIDRKGRFDAGKVNRELALMCAEHAVMQRAEDAAKIVEALRTADPVGEFGNKSQVLREIMAPVPLVTLADSTEKRVALSDCTWVSGVVGWGQPARNHAWFDEKIQDGLYLGLAGNIYTKGLYAHADSRFVFNVAGRWRSFSASVGLRDGAATQGSAIFKVLGDGRELFRSRLLQAGKKQDLDVDITGVKVLELIAVGGEGHNASSWAIWVDPFVRR